MTNNNSQTIIRRAILDDAAILAELGATTFTETFGHLYSAEDLQIVHLHPGVAYNATSIRKDHGMIGSPTCLQVSTSTKTVIGLSSAFALPQCVFFALGIEYPLDMTIERLHDPNPRHHRRPTAAT